MASYTDVINYWGLDCPNGGDFYICEDDPYEFVGCCTSDPCSSGKGCSQMDLRSLTFDPDMFGKLKDQACSNSGDNVGPWYSCRDTHPPFVGCCDVDPCGGGRGCPTENLVAGELSPDSAARDSFLHPSGLSSLTTISASSTSLLTTSASSTASSETTSSASIATSATNSPKDDDSFPIGAIVGISVGVTIGGLLVLGLLVWRLWVVPRKRKQQKRTAEEQAQQQPAQPAMIQPGFSPHFSSHASMGQYQASLIPSPTAPQYPSGVSSDIHIKTSPNPSNYDPSVSINVSDVSSVHGRPYPQGYSPGTMFPVHEMDGATVGPQEMSTGQEHSISP